MTNILLALILVLFCGSIGALAYLLLRVLAKFRQLEEEVRSFVSAPDEKTPSPLAQTIDMAGQVVGRAVVAQFKTTMMGIESGNTRAEKAIAADIAEDVAKQSPIGGLLDSFPALKKTLRRNPALLDFALSKLGSLNAAGAGNMPARSNGSSSQTKFNLGGL